MTVDTTTFDTIYDIRTGVLKATSVSIDTDIRAPVAEAIWLALSPFTSITRHTTRHALVDAVLSTNIEVIS